MGRFKLVALALFVLLVGGLGLAATQRHSLRAYWAERQLRQAPDELTRLQAARQLIALAPHSTERVLAILAAPGVPLGQAIVQAMAEQSTAGTDSIRYRVLTQAERFHPDHAAAFVQLVPGFLELPDAIPHCQSLVKAGLNATDSATRVAAIRLAARPELDLASSIVDRLKDDSPEVRRAALLAIGPVRSETPVLDDEALFAWLHDSDLEVRDLCESALMSRGLDTQQISLARKLSSPRVADRLDLLLELTRSRDVVRDPGPWLERLSRDSEPAVRAGAVRVASENGLRFVTWTERLAAQDHDPLVRRLAGYYRRQGQEIQPTASQE